MMPDENVGRKARLGAVLAVGVVSLLMVAPGSGAQTWFAPVTLTTFSPPDGTTGQGFGFGVAVDGDVLVAGKHGMGQGFDPSPGAAYVYVRSQAGWQFSQKIAANDARPDDRFGFQVAVSGDRIVVGAPRQDGAGGYAFGAAYVFVRSGSSWVQEAKLIPSARAHGSQFGTQVAIDGDVVVVGAYTDRPGAAYVFARSGSAWTQQAKLTYANPRSEYYGVGVSVSGDTVAVSGAADQADIYTRAGATWTRQATVTTSDGVGGYKFVALRGDVLAVGAPSATVPAVPGNLSTAGVVYIFTRSGGTWTEGQKLTALLPSAGALFGLSLALGADTLAVSAFFDQSIPLAGPKTGTLAVFSNLGGIWQQTSRPFALDGAEGDRLGDATVGLSGATLVSGAANHNAKEGKVYVFDGVGA